MSLSECGPSSWAKMDARPDTRSSRSGRAACCGGRNCSTIRWLDYSRALTVANKVDRRRPSVWRQPDRTHRGRHRRPDRSQAGRPIIRWFALRAWRITLSPAQLQHLRSPIRLAAPPVAPRLRSPVSRCAAPPPRLVVAPRHQVAQRRALAPPSEMPAPCPRRRRPAPRSCPPTSPSADPLYRRRALAPDARRAVGRPPGRSVTPARPGTHRLRPT